jgi:hypothetical protein
MEALVYLLQAFAYFNIAALAFYMGRFVAEVALGKFRS